MADQSPTSASPPTSANRTKKTRDELILEYVIAAREKVPPSTKGNTSPTASSPLPAPGQPVTRPSPVARSASQWPFPKETGEGPMPTGCTQGELAPYRDRAPQQHQGYQRAQGPQGPQGHQRPPYGGPTHQQHQQPQQMQRPYQGVYRGPYRGKNPESDIYGMPTGPPDYRNQPRGPPPRRGPPNQQQQFRMQNSAPLASRFSTRSDTRATTDYIPSPNVQAPLVSTTHSPARFIPPPQIMALPERPQMLSVAHSPIIPAIAEENENRTSLVPSISSGGGASDVLSDYYRPESSQGSVETHTEASPAETAALGREVSVSHLQKPTLTIIRTPSTSRQDENGSSRILAGPFEEPLHDDGLEVEPLQLRTPKTPETSFHTPMTSPSQDRFLAPSSPGAAPLGFSHPNDSLSKLDSKTSRDSLSAPKTIGSPRSRSKSPLRLIESKFRRSTAEPESTSPALQPPRSYFATAPSSSTVDLVAKHNLQLPADDGAAADKRTSRASMTSLPGLITRALRLATNLERGKTSSKFGMEWMLSGDNDTTELTEKDKHNSTASLKTMLRSFPVTPGVTSPGADRGQLPLSQWPKDRSGLRQSQLMSSPPSDAGDDTHRRRQCCFMPLWLFIVVLVVLVLVIAAAIIIPVVLIVIPNQDHAMASAHALAACTRTDTCAHSGTSTLEQNSACSCLCVNGWSGPACNDQDMTGCVTTDLLGSSASVGSTIPRLITFSQTSTIPLNAKTLFESFISANLSCASQNALVTFDGVVTRRLLLARQAPATSNGIIFAQSGSPTPTSVAASSPLPTELSASGTTTGSVTPVYTSEALPQHDIDFARTAVLYIFEHSSDLTTAVHAQEALQHYISQPFNPMLDPYHLGLGGGWTADVLNGTMTKS